MSNIWNKITNLVSQVTGTLGIANGGTNGTTATTGFNNLSPMTTAGDLIYGGTSGAGTRLAGATGVLHSTGAATPSWATIVDADVDAAAAIAGSKLVAASGSVAGAVTTGAQTFAGAKTLTSVAALNGGWTSTGQKGFYVYKSGTAAGPTNTTATINLDTIDFNQGSGLSGQVFTAPVTGKYVFGGQLQASAGSGTGNAIAIALVVTGSQSITRYLGHATLDTLFRTQIGGSCMISLVASDTVTFNAYSNGAATWTVNDLTLAGATSWWGYQVM